MRGRERGREREFHKGQRGRKKRVRERSRVQLMQGSSSPEWDTCSPKAGLELTGCGVQTAEL